jgi:hypothetical protein
MTSFKKSRKTFFSPVLDEVLWMRVGVKENRSPSQGVRGLHGGKEVFCLQDRLASAVHGVSVPKVSQRKRQHVCHVPQGIYHTDRAGPNVHEVLF